MGCQVSSDSSQFERSDYDRLWKRMNSVSEQTPVAQKKKSGKGKKNGWRIIRVILVSTYKDFRNERKAALDLIENKLQPYATEKQVFLQVEDFSWGSKAHLEEASCLYPIERLRREAASSSSSTTSSSSSSSSSTYFYLHFLGECSGYLIDHTFTDDAFLREHAISSEQSFSEVFLQLAGLQNPNSLFLYRNPSFLQELPFNVTNFIDSPANRERAKYLTSMVKGSVSPSQFVEYSVRTSGINNIHFKHILFDDLSGATRPIDELINRYLDELPDGESKVPSAEELLKEHFEELGNENETLQKVKVNIKMGKSTLIVGDYSTGKTVLLHAIGKSSSKAVLVKGREHMSVIELRRAIEAKSKELVDPHQKNTRVLMVDDVHLMSKEAQEYLVGSEELVIVATSRKKKVAVDMEKISIPSMDPEDILEELSFWLNGGMRERRAVPSVKASNIFKMSQQKRRKSVGTVEDGHSIDENMGWNSLKCRVIGTLGRFGSSEEKCAQLSQLSTLR
ncbi:unnamed protein product [Caenorhabditis sp. 36 PRJEB53466]|nr:unnamed protein product [Caenorhabditis sp. 36 PRJEB53466]